MNEQLQKQLAEIIAAVHRAASAGADFALSQLPDIAQQYIVYGRVSYTLYTLIGLGLIATAMLAIWKAYRLSAKGRDNDAFTFALPGVFGGLLVAAPVFAFNVNSMLMVWFAPKVWLLKELAGLLK